MGTGVSKMRSHASTIVLRAVSTPRAYLVQPTSLSIEAGTAITGKSRGGGMSTGGRSVPANHDQTIDSSRPQTLSGSLTMPGLEKPLAAARAEDGPAQPPGGVDVSFRSHPIRPETHREIDEATVDETLVPLLDTDRLEVAGRGHLCHRPEGGVHAGGIPAGGEGRNASHSPSVGAETQVYRSTPITRTPSASGDSGSRST